MSMAEVDVATFKEQAETLFAKAVAGEATIIEQNGQRAVLLACDGAVPDFVLYPKLDALLQERLKLPAREATEADWQALRDHVLKQK